MSDSGDFKPRFPADIQGKIETAIDYKNKGNEYFKNGLHKKAIVNYSTALAFTKGLPGRKQGLEGVSQMAMNESKSSGEQISPEQDQAVSDLDVVLKTNIATCHMKLNDPVKSLEVIREALALNPTAWKSLLRKAEATLMINDPEKAVKILAEASTHAPDEAAETAILKVKERAVKVIKQQEAKQRKAFGNIFEKANALDEAK